MSEPNLKRIAPLFAMVGMLFFSYGFYLLMLDGNVFEAVMFIVAYLLFMYASVTMDDNWVVIRETID